MSLIIIDTGGKRKAGKNKDYVRKDELLVDGKVKPELLPDTTHEKTDLQPLENRVAALEQSPKGGGSSFVVTDLAYTAETMSLSLEQMFIVALTKNPKADIVRITKTKKDKFSGDSVLTETFVRIPDFEIARLDGGAPRYPYLPRVNKLAFMRVTNRRRYAAQPNIRKDGTKLDHYIALFIESALDESFYTYAPSNVEGQDGQFNTADGNYEEDEQVKWYKQFLTAPKNTVESSAQGLPEEYKQLPEKLQELTKNVGKLSEKQESQESEITEALKLKTELKTELSKSFVSPSQIWDNGTSGQLTPDFADSVRGAASSGLLSVLDEELQKIRAEIAVQSVRDEMEQHKADTARTIAELQSNLANAEKVIDWLGGDLLRVTTDVPTRDGKFAATRMFPFAVKLPGGIHAYALKKDQDLTKNLQFEMIGEGKDVPAYTPVFLMAEENKEYILSPAPYSAPIDTGFLGSTQTITPAMRDQENFKYYVFIQNKQGYGEFRQIQKYNIIPFRAYFRIPKDYVYKPAEAAATTES